MCFNENSPVKDPLVLMYEYSLNDFLSLRQAVEIVSAFQEADVLDKELKNPKNKPGTK